MTAGEGIDMRIAIIDETSAADRNADIVAALDGGGSELINCGMKKGGRHRS
jgi:ribose 5-phosphate isomerase RpiB